MTEYEGVEYSTYKGKPVISLDRTLTIGLRKAKLVLKYYNEIKQFVETNGG